jgi:hypothetical protein
LETEKFKLKDLFDGLVIPILLVVLIFFFGIYLNPQGSFHLLGNTSVIAVILTQGFAQMIVLGVPLALGLLWNKWAGGAAGFITGGFYYVASAGLYTGYYASYDTSFYHIFFGDMSMLGYLVNAVIIGYMAGALSNGSSNFKRMLGAAMTASVVTAVIQVYLNYNFALDFTGGSAGLVQYSPRAMAHGLWTDTSLGFAGVYGFVLAFVPSIALGVIVPILAKVMTWYGIQPMKHK